MCFPLDFKNKTVYPVINTQVSTQGAFHIEQIMLLLFEFDKTEILQTFVYLLFFYPFIFYEQITFYDYHYKACNVYLIYRPTLTSVVVTLSISSWVGLALKPRGKAKLQSLRNK